jgi:hypothetical protein
MAGSPMGTSNPGVSPNSGRQDSQSWYRPMRLGRPEREPPLGSERVPPLLALRLVSRVHLKPPPHTGFETTSTQREREASPQSRPSGPSPLALQPVSGLPLESALRSGLERLMGFDLGHVRLHTDSTAASWAFRLQAHAFTVGQHVFFGAGRFRPQTRAGLEMLVHELSHVRQQPGNVPLQWGQVTLMQYKTLEEEAQTQAHAALAGVRLASQMGSPGALLPLGQPAGGYSAPGGIFPGFPSHAMPLPGGSGAFPPLILSYGSRTTPVVPLRQESTVSPTEVQPPGAETVAGATPGAPSPAAPDPERLAQQVYTWIQRRLRIDAERRGVQRWH